MGTDKQQRAGACGGEKHTLTPVQQSDSQDTEGAFRRSAAPSAGRGPAVGVQAQRGRDLLGGREPPETLTLDVLSLLKTYWGQPHCEFQGCSPHGCLTSTTTATLGGPKPPCCNALDGLAERVPAMTKKRSQSTRGRARGAESRAAPRVRLPCPLPQNGGGAGGPGLGVPRRPGWLAAQGAISASRGTDATRSPRWKSWGCSGGMTCPHTTGREWPRGKPRRLCHV